MITQSNIEPQPRQYLQGKLLVSFDVTSEETEEGLVYTYHVLKLPEESTELQVVDAITAYKAELKVNTITPRQARLKLLEVGLLDELEVAITTNRAWQIEWEYATEVKRDSPLIAAIASQVGLGDQQLDELFIAASKL